MQALEAELEEHTSEEFRAAAMIVLVVGRDYVWPPEVLDRVLELARSRLSEARQLEVVGKIPEFAEVFEREIASPGSRIDSVRSYSHRRAWMALA